MTAPILIANNLASVQLVVIVLCLLLLLVKATFSVRCMTFLNYSY